MNDVSRTGSTELLAVAVAAATEAGALLASSAGHVAVADTKSSPTDVVTEMDRRAEELIRARILADRPGDVILGEEGGQAGEVDGAPVRWVVDPLDGTVNYLYGLTDWAVSIAAEVAGQIVAGAVYVPKRGELFTAARGAGAWLYSADASPRSADASPRSADASPRPADASPRPEGARPRPGSGMSRAGAHDIPEISADAPDGAGTRLHCHEDVPMDRALVATGFGYQAARRKVQGEVVAALLPLVRDIRRAGAASVDLCSVAAGRVDGYYERGLNYWDYAAGALIAAEAGATVGDSRGGPPSTSLTIAAGPGLFGPLADALAGLGAERG